MPVPLIVPNTARFVVTGNIWGRPWANTWDVYFNEGAPARYDKLDDIAANIIDGYAAYLPARLGTDWDVRSIRWVDLDNAGGAVGSLSDTAAAWTAPVAGVNAGTLPANVAVLLVKNTTGGRKQRKGRVFIPGWHEGEASGNVISAGPMTSWTTAANNLLSKINTAVGGVTMQACVVHKDNTGAISQTPITSLSVAPTLATQRQRLRP